MSGAAPRHVTAISGPARRGRVGVGETDLIGPCAAVAPGAALLSPRGQVLENGTPSVFRRLAGGVFGEADVQVAEDWFKRRDSTTEEAAAS